MPTYIFRCADCNNQREVFLRFSEYDNFDRTCSCGGTLKQIIETLRVHGIEIKTVGQLAERNAARKGRYGREDYEQKIKAERRKAKEALYERLDLGTPPPENPPETWYGRPDKEMVKKLANATQEQKADYILKGKEPT